MKEITPDLRVRVLIEFVATARNHEELSIFGVRLQEAMDDLFSKSNRLPNPRTRLSVPPVINIPPLDP